MNLGGRTIQRTTAIIFLLPLLLCGLLIVSIVVAIPSHYELLLDVATSSDGTIAVSTQNPEKSEQKPPSLPLIADPMLTTYHLSIDGEAGGHVDVIFGGSGSTIAVANARVVTSSGNVVKVLDSTNSGLSGSVRLSRRPNLVLFRLGASGGARLTYATGELAPPRLNLWLLALGSLLTAYLLEFLIVALARASATFLVTAGLVLVVLAGFTTFGTWNVVGEEDFGGYYDWQALAFLHNRIDVPPEAIGAEGVVYHGLYYGYFGPAPALLHIPTSAVDPVGIGHWSRLSALAAVLVMMLFGYRLLTLLWQSLKSGPAPPVAVAILTLLIGLGSCQVFLVSRTYVYHEASLWGAAAATAFTFYLARLLVDRATLEDVGRAGFWAAFALFSRPTFGIGSFIALGLIGLLFLFQRDTASAYGRAARYLAGTAARSKGSPGGIAISSFLAIVVTAVAFGVWNDVRFDSPTTVVPLQYHLGHSPERLAYFGRSEVKPNNIPHHLLAYLSPLRLGFSRNFPWVNYPAGDVCRCNSAQIDLIEPTASLVPSAPALTLLALLGIFLAFGGSQGAWLRIPLLGAAVSVVPVLTAVGVTNRYLEDFMPFVFVAAANGIIYLCLEGSRLRRWLPIVLALTTISILFNAALALRFQGEIAWGVPLPYTAWYQGLQKSLDVRWAGPVYHPTGVTVLGGIGQPYATGGTDGRAVGAVRVDGDAIFIPRVDGWCPVSRDVTGIYDAGFEPLRPFLAPIGFLVPCAKPATITVAMLAANAPSEVVAFATTITRRPVSASLPAFLSDFRENLEAIFTDEPCEQPSTLPARVLCVRTAGVLQRNRFLGVLDSDDRALYFASALSGEPNPPFSGVAITGLTLVAGTRYFVYDFSPAVTTPSVLASDDALHRIVRAFADVNAHP